MPFNLADYPEAFAYPFHLSRLSAWVEHLPLAPILIKLLRPRTLVELGTHGGDSYLAFCQAVRTMGTGTTCTAVDTWTGDIHTGAYGPEVLQNLRAVHDGPFSGFSRLLQSTFDAAAATFADGTIDLLHIDGGHTYEAVRHDLETWRAKLSPRGVVLFHDTCERHQDFGVWKLWDEISPGHPHANLPHGHGLGILGLGPEQPPEFLDFLHALNTQPGLVGALKSLGAQGNLLMAYSGAMGNMVQCQSLVNEWRQRTGQPILNSTANAGDANVNPDVFGAALVRDVHQMAVDALNLAAEVMTLRQKK